MPNVWRRSPGTRSKCYLQFDGFQRRTLQLIRGDGDLLEKKLAALTNCEELGINTVLVMVMTPGINDGEVGAFLERAQKSPVVRKVMIQPAMYSGRYDNPRRVDRTTVADVVARICEQSGGTFHPRDFGPIPCSDPNCFSMAAHPDRAHPGEPLLCAVWHLVQARHQGNHWRGEPAV
ncbi:MAG: hypothetical protein IPI55_19980 [Flavobacteriales bacterium]|nr:hypothetical protein [Flavobacteriales bacterium]